MFWAAERPSTRGVTTAPPNTCEGGVGAGATCLRIPFPMAPFGAHMSAGHLSREFRLAYGESPYAYLITRRIERAMALLRRCDLSVTEVCFAVGCSSLGTFSSRFSELVGMPPSTYRHHAARATAGMPSCVAKQVTRPIRNREAPVTSRT